MIEDKTLYALVAENNRILRALAIGVAGALTPALPKPAASDDHDTHLRVAMSIPDHPIHRDVEDLRRRYGADTESIRKTGEGVKRPSIDTPEKMAHVLRTGELPPRPSFVECSACRTQPSLCAECLERRALFAQRDETARCLWSMLRVEKPQDPSLEAALSQVTTHLASGGLAGATVALIESKVRDAALEEAKRVAANAIPMGGPASAVVFAIDALKSKPAPQPSGNSGELPERKAVRRLGSCPACGETILHFSRCRMGDIENPATPEPVHDFGWALARMREGKTVRRSQWSVGVMIHIPRSEQHAPFRDVDGSHRALGLADIDSTDWQVVA